MQEEWKHYIRYARNQFGAAWIETDLEISNYGRIKDGGIFRYKKFTNEMIHVNVNGHRCIGSGHSNYCIYHLVYELFVEPIPKGYVVHHKDHNKHNDRVDNLEMMTKAEHNSIHHKNKLNHINIFLHKILPFLHYYQIECTLYYKYDLL